MSEFSILIILHWCKLLYPANLFCTCIRISLLIHCILYLKFSLPCTLLMNQQLITSVNLDNEKCMNMSKGMYYLLFVLLFLACSFLLNLRHNVVLRSK